MQSVPSSNPSKLPEKLLSPVPLRCKAWGFDIKARSVGKSAILKGEKKGGRTGFSNFDAKTSSSWQSEDKTETFIGEVDLNGLMLLREDSRNPQARDDCFRCINFDDVRVEDVIE